MKTSDVAATIALAASLALSACSGGGSEIQGTWRAVADTAAPMPSVLYEFRPDHTMVLHMRAQDTETEGTWMLGQNGGVRVEFGEGSYFAGRELEGRLLGADSLMLEIQGEERIFVPHDTTAGGSGTEE